MDPKLLRMYSDILNEAPATNPQAQSQKEVSQGSILDRMKGFFSGGQPAAGTAAPVKPVAGTAAPVRGARGGTGPVVPPGSKPTTTATTKTAPQGGRPTPTPANSMAARGKVDAMKGSQTTDAMSRTSSYTGTPQTSPAATATAPAAQTTPDQMRTTTATTTQSIGATNLQGQDPTDQTTPDQMPTTTATTAQSIGATNLQGQDPARQNTAAPARQGGYASSATGAEGQGGTQAARPTTQEPAVTSSSGAPVTTGSGGVLRSRTPDEIAASGPMGLPNPRPAAKPVPDTSAGTGPNLGTGSYFEEELEEEIEESVDQELEEAFNEMLRLSGIQLNEKAPPGAKAERMVKHIKKGYAKDGKLSDKEKSIAFATAWKAKKAGKLDEGFRVMMDEEGHTLEHIVNRFKHEAKTFLNTGEMSDKLYDALYDYYLDRGEMPYGIAKAREGDPYTWVAARFEADIDGTVDVKMRLGEVGGDDALNELARLAGLSESRVDECGDMGMDTEDRLNVSTNMSSDGTRSVNISAQGEKAEELLAMLKLAGMGSSDRPIVAMIDRDEEMMEADRETEYANTPSEEYETVDRIIRQGNDLNREKKQFANMPKVGDNPMATDYMLDEELSALLDSVLVKETDPQRPKGDTGVADIFTAGKGIAPPSPDEGPVGKSPITPKAPAAPKAPIAPGIKR